MAPRLPEYNLKGESFEEAVEAKSADLFAKLKDAHSPDELIPMIIHVSQTLKPLNPKKFGLVMLELERCALRLLRAHPNFRSKGKRDKTPMGEDFWGKVAPFFTDIPEGVGATSALETMGEMNDVYENCNFPFFGTFFKLYYKQINWYSYEECKDEIEGPLDPFFERMYLRYLEVYQLTERAQQLLERTGKQTPLATLDEALKNICRARAMSEILTTIQAPIAEDQLNRARVAEDLDHQIEAVRERIHLVGTTADSAVPHFEDLKVGQMAVADDEVKRTSTSRRQAQ